MAGIISSAWTQDQATQGYKDAKAQGWDDARIAKFAKDNGISTEMQARAADTTGGNQAAFNLLMAGDPTGKAAYDVGTKYGVTDGQFATMSNNAVPGASWDSKSIDTYAVNNGFRQAKPTPAQTLQTLVQIPQISVGPAATYQAAQVGAPTKWEVTPDQTVQGQLLKINDPNSPIIAQARTQALKDMNSRGLTNSAMAISAGEDAAYRASMPIAQQDASTYASAAGKNADASNSMRMFDVTGQNQAGQFNAGAQNTLTGQKLASDTSLATAGMSAQTSRDIAAAGNEVQRYGIDTNAATSKYGADLGATTQRYGIDTGAATSKYNTDTNAASSKYNTDVGSITQKEISASNNATSKEIAAGNNATSMGVAAMNAQAQAASNAAQMAQRSAEFTANMEYNKGVLNNQKFQAYSNGVMTILNGEDASVADKQFKLNAFADLYKAKPVSLPPPTNPPATTSNPTTSTASTTADNPVGQTVTAVGSDGQQVSGEVKQAPNGKYYIALEDGTFQEVSPS